jgi:hypothetical protein
MPVTLELVIPHELGDAAEVVCEVREGVEAIEDRCAQSGRQWGHA